MSFGLNEKKQERTNGKRRGKKRLLFPIEHSYISAHI